MPKGANITFVGMRGEEPSIWAEVDTDNDIEERTFALALTGHPIPFSHEENADRIGVFIKNSGNGLFVGHVYELLNRRL